MNRKAFCLFFTSLIFLGSTCIAQQDVYLGAGYTISYWPLSGLNKVIDQYEISRNPNNPPADNPERETTSSVSKINLLQGLSISGGVLIQPDLNLEFRFMNRGNSGWESRVETENNEFFERTMRVRTNSFGFGVSKFLGGSRRDYILGGTFNLTNLQVDLSEAGKTASGVVNQNMFGVTGFMKFIYKFKPGSPWGISIVPYLQYHLTDTDFSGLNKVMNPMTSSALQSRDTQGARFNGGLELQVNYFIFNKYYQGE